MLFHDILGRLVKVCAALGLSLGFVAGAQAAVEELADEVLSEVSASDGVTINFSLQWNPNRTEVDLASSFSLTFTEHGVNTHWVMHGFGGAMDMWGLKIDARKGPADVGDYVEVTMPAYIGFKDFGVQAMAVQTQAEKANEGAFAAPKASYGQWYWNGSATVTGSMYIWPAK